MDRAEYFKQYNAQNKDKQKRVTLRFTPIEYRSLKKSADKVGQKPAPYIKSLALQAHANSVELPVHIQDELKELDRLIRTIANNINQMARHSNRIANVLDENEPLLEIAKLHSLLQTSIEHIARKAP